mmetsp:Transcript_18147/g.45297  ORF Transcript_18147/g.45297 Transcript_18147/m.45297 type:complete len:86 (-) Transcript_18147:393-650(-)
MYTYVCASVSVAPLLVVPHLFTLGCKWRWNEKVQLCQAQVLVWASFSIYVFLCCSFFVSFLPSLSPFSAHPSSPTLLILPYLSMK